MAQMNLSTKQKQTHRQRKQTCNCQGGRGREGMGWTGSLGLVDANYLEWINNEVLLHSTGNYIQSLGVDHDGRYYKKENVYICMTGSLYYTAEIGITL